MENIIIIPGGHYQRNRTIGSEHAEIIRVWGELSNGKWKTSEGIMSAELISNEYTFIQTAPTEELANKNSKKADPKLLEGL